MVTQVENWQYLSSGKVRDLYQPIDGTQKLLMVATDRISAFDYVLPNLIPNKGKILNQISLFFFDLLKETIPNHLLPIKPPSVFSGRAVVIKPLTMFPIESVVRGYLTGSGWAEYQNSQSVCGIELPAGLKDGSKLPEPIFTPATKALAGDHDENISFSKCVELIGQSNAELIRKRSIEIYQLAADFALSKGIIIADTKFEFGLDESLNLTLGDEVLTPDSSRFWDLSGYEPGKAQPSFDKQYVRDYLLQSGWDRASTPPSLPQNVVDKTLERYQTAYERLTGNKFNFDN